MKRKLVCLELVENKQTSIDVDSLQQGVIISAIRADILWMQQSLSSRDDDDDDDTLFALPLSFFLLS